MLLKELMLFEETHTLPKVYSPADLIDPKTGKYYTGTVSVTGSVRINKNTLSKIPVQFGEVGGNFFCGSNRLTSLKGAPQKVGSTFSCNKNRLTSLEDAPQEIVDGDFTCNGNKITSLEGIHKIIKKINGEFYIADNPLKSGGLGLILIEGLTNIIADFSASKIINKFLGQGKKGLLLCQEELIEAGYEEYAKL